MKILKIIFASALLVCSIQAASMAQSSNVTETLKEHFNETVQSVYSTDNADEKRSVLDESFNKMITALDQIESRAALDEDQTNDLETYRFLLTEKLNELNGLDGFEEVKDEDLNDFTDYSQNIIEQANRTLTIGLGTALLIVIILLLL